MIKTPEEVRRQEEQKHDIGQIIKYIEKISEEVKTVRSGRERVLRRQTRRAVEGKEGTGESNEHTKNRTETKVEDEAFTECKDYRGMEERERGSRGNRDQRLKERYRVTKTDM